MEKHILLSICIPTYNRAEYLKNTIQSIVNQTRFSDSNDVEIVISDNCSSDHTPDIVEKFIEKFGDKIRYYRNTENIEALNVEKVLSYGKGEFLKLNNDTLLHRENSLDKIIELIETNLIDKNILFLSNGVIKDLAQFVCMDLNEFLKRVSFYSTWIVCYGIWKEHFNSINDFNKDAHLLFPHTGVLFRQVSSGHNVYVDNTQIFDSVTPKAKGGYNIFEVFITNYLYLVKEFVKSKNLSLISYEVEKYNLFRHHLKQFIFEFIFLKNDNHNFDIRGFWRILFSKYWYEPYLLPSLLFLWGRKKKKQFFNK